MTDTTNPSCAANQPHASTAAPDPATATTSDTFPGPPYVTCWEHLWSDSPTHVIRITDEDLPHVIPGNTHIPPCTVRYTLPGTGNSNNMTTTDRYRHDLVGELFAIDARLAEDAEINFPRVIESRDNKRAWADITVSTPQLFHQLENVRIMLDGFELEVWGSGAPVPANILTVAISHLPSQTNRPEMAKLLVDALMRYDAEINIWDVYARMVRYPYLPNSTKFCGSIFAAVQFTQASPKIFPDAEVHSTFPGFIKIRNIVYELEYAGRIDHCFQCKDRALRPHTESECTNLHCWYCGQNGYTRRVCPQFAENQNEDQHLPPTLGEDEQLGGDEPGANETVVEGNDAGGGDEERQEVTEGNDMELLEILQDEMQVDDGLAEHPPETQSTPKTESRKRSRWNC